jgi:EF-P beta-lysylation protein EpmB
MIHQSSSFWQTSDWQNALKNSIRSVDELLAFVDVKLDDLDKAYQASLDFAIKVPLHYASLIERGNAFDPLLLQVLPQSAELLEQAGFSADPLEEQHFNVAPGLIHKYSSRVLLIANPSCAIHCRYCFRRHFDYQSNTQAKRDWSDAFRYIAKHQEVNEVVLSGGDPLSCNDDYLAFLIGQTEANSHIDTLRIHSRIPTTMPERISDSFLALLENTRLKPLLVLHINHANELSAEACEAILLLQQIGVRVLNQSVLLKGVNDNLQAQTQLLNALHTLDVQAYYLHQLDHVAGAAHFLVTDEQALSLYKQLQSTMAGHKLPKLVREIAKQAHKTALHY